MNPDTNRFEQSSPALKDVEAKLRQELAGATSLLRPNGEPVPQHWTQFRDGETVVIKNYTFRVKAIGETYILLEPAAVSLIGAEKVDTPEPKR